jgi:hypothetical protein
MGRLVLTVRIVPALFMLLAVFLLTPENVARARGEEKGEEKTKLTFQLFQKAKEEALTVSRVSSSIRIVQEDTTEERVVLELEEAKIPNLLRFIYAIEEEPFTRVSEIRLAFLKEKKDWNARLTVLAYSARDGLTPVKASRLKTFLSRMISAADSLFQVGTALGKMKFQEGDLAFSRLNFQRGNSFIYGNSKGIWFISDLQKELDKVPFLGATLKSTKKLKENLLSFQILLGEIPEQYNREAFRPSRIKVEDIAKYLGRCKPTGIAGDKRKPIIYLYRVFWLSGKVEAIGNVIQETRLKGTYACILELTLKDGSRRLINLSAARVVEIHPMK